MFETASEYANITAFNIKEIVLDSNGVDSEH